jgi:hypothetical protein
VLIAHIFDTVQDALALAPPTPTPSASVPPDSPVIVNTPDVVGAAAKYVVPLLMCLTGLVIMSRSRNGQVSKVVTSGGISIIGIMFIAGGGLFFAVGEKIVNLFIG